MEETNAYFRVPCEIQIRARVIDQAEFEMFQKVTLRPSPVASLRSEIESLMRVSSLDESLRGVIANAFSLMLNIDQRLDRIEEDLSLFIQGKKEHITPYEWTRVELGAEGFLAQLAQLPKLTMGDLVLVDFLLPSFPEQRIVAAVKVVEDSNPEEVHFRFECLHDEDLEGIFRFIRSREREILRSRKK